MRLFVGDDWAEDHHDIEVVDEAGAVLARRRLPEGSAGITQQHALIGAHLPEDAEDAEVVVGIERDHSPWVSTLVAAGYAVFPGEPAAGVAVPGPTRGVGAKSDRGDAHVLADVVRTDAHQLRPATGDSAEVKGIKVVARTHKTLIWERARQVQRLRHQLLEYFPAAVEAFGDLAAPDALELLGRAPDPDRGRQLTRAPGRGRAQARPPTLRRGLGHRDPGRAAQPAAGPAAGPDRGLRRDRPVPHRGDHRAERARHRPGRAGDRAVWAAPGR